jgi:hypothetical protein
MVLKYKMLTIKSGMITLNQNKMLEDILIALIVGFLMMLLQWDNWNKK